MHSPGIGESRLGDPRRGRTTAAQADEQTAD